MARFHRERLAHPPAIERFNQATILLITVCAKNRRPILASDEVCDALRSAWEDASHWRVAEFLLMPDHIHIFCVRGLLDPEPVTRWCGYWKRLAGLRLPILKGQFQGDVWDRQIRSAEELEEKRSYVRMNPVRAGLCDTPEMWPYSGIIRDIGW